MASDQMLRGCVYVCAYVCFSYGNEASKGWLSVSQRFEGSWVEGWRMRDRRMETSGWGWMNNQDLTALVFFSLAEFIPMALWRKCLFFLIVTDLLLYFWYILNSYLQEISPEHMCLVCNSGQPLLNFICILLVLYFIQTKQIAPKNACWEIIIDSDSK